MGICRPCSVAMFATRLGAAAAAGGTLVSSHALVGARWYVCWVGGTSGLGVGALAIEWWWRWVGVAGSLIAPSVVGRVVRLVGRSRRCRDIRVHRRRGRISGARCIARCRSRAVWWGNCCWLRSVSKWAGEECRKRRLSRRRESCMNRRATTKEIKHWRFLWHEGRRNLRRRSTHQHRRTRH